MIVFAGIVLELIIDGRITLIISDQGFFFTQDSPEEIILNLLFGAGGLPDPHLFQYAVILFTQLFSRDESSQCHLLISGWQAR